jgi:hypothetical protein
MVSFICPVLPCIITTPVVLEAVLLAKLIALRCEANTFTGRTLPSETTAHLCDSPAITWYLPTDADWAAFATTPPNLFVYIDFLAINKFTNYNQFNSICR